MEQQKKEWVKPELLVLVRNKPEEAVLTACKGNMVASSPGSQGFWCENQHCFSGDNCSVLSSS
ncbi:MAG: hypothetical protein FJ009_20555 [Chloroflexi bacterium]|nr:hypothetical protein [Chloroflexota bacterium]